MENEGKFLIICATAPPFVNGWGRGVVRFDGDGGGSLFYRQADGKEWIGDNELRGKWQKKKKVLTLELV